ncbi:Fungal protein of unknown function (DUF1770) domain containing protein [Rhypophila decipiens]
MASSLPLQLAETIQTAHINKDPSAEHDINPSTATSKREPVTLEQSEEQEKAPVASSEKVEIRTKETTTEHYKSLFQQNLHHGGKDELDTDEEDDELQLVDEETQPFSILHGKSRSRRGRHLPPLPDLRYEQSYLHSIREADTWWKIGLITARDQVMMPFAQGILYNLGICGWQYWNRNARVHGSSLGARLRRWWYGVNNWPIPPPGSSLKSKFGKQM